MKRISATQASRGFADVLDRVAERGERYVIERRGRDVATLEPAAGASRTARTIGDLLVALRSSPAADRRFVSDLRRIRRSQGRPRDPWASSSTRHS